MIQIGGAGGNSGRGTTTVTYPPRVVDEKVPWWGMLMMTALAGCLMFVFIVGVITVGTWLS